MRRLLDRSPAVSGTSYSVLRGGCVALAVTLLLAACAPEVGSEKWCESIREKGLGNITPNEAADYARHCVLQ